MREVAIQKPTSEKDLLKIKGFTQRMFNKIGKEFLEVLNNRVGKQNQNKSGNKIPSNIKETFNLLRKGYGLKDIASLRKLSEAVISMQIESIIEYEPSVNISHLFEKDQFEIINDELKKGFEDLKDLKKRLPEEITYPQIRIAVAKNKFMSPSLSSTAQGS